MAKGPPLAKGPPPAASPRFFLFGLSATGQRVTSGWLSWMMTARFKIFYLWPKDHLRDPLILENKPQFF
jgi:hypothetical protein